MCFATASWVLYHALKSSAFFLNIPTCWTVGGRVGLGVEVSYSHTQIQIDAWLLACREKCLANVRLGELVGGAGIDLASTPDPSSRPLMMLFAIFYPRYDSGSRGVIQKPPTPRLKPLLILLAITQLRWFGIDKFFSFNLKFCQFVFVVLIG